MKRRIVYVLSASVVSVLMVTAPAFAHNVGPCPTDPMITAAPGHSEFAQHHILPAVPEEGHKPGAHMGYSACLGVH